MVWDAGRSCVGLAEDLTTEEVLRVNLLLTSRESELVTGQTLVVEGATPSTGRLRPDFRQPRTRSKEDAQWHSSSE